MYNVIVEDEFGTIRGQYQYSSLGEAKRSAKAGAKHEQGRAVVVEGGVLLREYKYEDGDVLGYDDEGNPVENV